MDAAGAASTQLTTLAEVEQAIARCRQCPRLVAWREQIAEGRRAAYRDWEYWGRPVPGYGDHDARLFVLGLAPAAHGGNRTGRVFTGDRSGDWLFGAMHRAGFASSPHSVHRDDGLALHDAYVAAAVRCAPPANKPLPAERDACQPFLERELALLSRLKVIVALGAYAMEAACRVTGLRPRPKFGHGMEAVLPGGVHLLCSYHPSQHNTFTGRLTEPMFDAVFARARTLIDGAH
jgi:uracil-DNA glycosylase family 4